MRAELLATLKRIHEDTDCSSIDKDEKNGPVELKEDADINSETVIPKNGTRIGRFSVIATKYDDEIKLELAAFKKRCQMLERKLILLQIQTLQKLEKVGQKEKIFHME